MVVQSNFKPNQRVTLVNQRIGFKNFKGEKDMYNEKGKRSFVVFLDEETANRMVQDGLPVKWPKPKEGIDQDEDNRQPYLPITITPDDRIPNPSVRLYIVDGDNETQIDNENIAMIDDVDIDFADITFSVYFWEFGKEPNKREGITPYLSALKIYLRSADFTPNYY